VTEATATDVQALFEKSVDWSYYPTLRDAALSNEGNSKALDDLATSTEAKKGSENAVRRGLAFVILGRVQSAQEALEAAHPKFEVGSYYLGKSYMNLGDQTAAVLKFREALAEHPDSAQLGFALVHAMLLKGEVEEAADVLKRATERFGENADTQFLHGFLRELEGEYLEAKGLYEKVLEGNPEHPQALFRLARYHHTYGEELEALDCYERLRNVRPTYAQALLNLGSLYEDLGTNEKAIECFQEVLKAVPNHPRAILFLADSMSSKTMYYDEEGERRADRQSAILKIPVTDFELSVRSRNCLNKMNIRTLGDLIQMTEPELLAHKNFGETSLMEVKQMLAQKGLRLGQGKMEGVAFPTPAAPTEVSEETLTMHIDTLDLSVRSRKCMERLGITSVGALIGRTEAELLTAKNFGQTSLNEIKMRLEERGLRLKDAPY
jgi:DNA-directed RNA polymerase subunit alpha